MGHLSELNTELTEANNKIAFYEDWLLEHFNSPHFEQVLRDKRHFEIRRYTLDFQIENLKNRRPSHGESVNLPGNDPNWIEKGTGNKH